MLINRELDGYTYTFSCHKDNPKRPKDWDVDLEFVSFWALPFEARITLEHFYTDTFFIGRHSRGFYISIPSLYASADIGWMDNPDQISTELKKAKLPQMIVISLTRAVRIINDVICSENSKYLKKLCIKPVSQKR